MSDFFREKRITYPFDDRVKARILGYVSSGSEHSAHAVDDDDVASPSLSDLFFTCVLSDNESNSRAGPATESSENDPDADPVSPALSELRFILLHDHADSFRNVLRANVVKALELLSSVEADKSILLRKVMSVLRNLGYNAGVCKSKWDSCGGLTAGSHEYIDVVVNLDSSSSSSSSSTHRYLVDLDLASEFEIARPTSSFKRILQTLPNVYVGKAEELKKIIKVVSEGARRSLKSRGLHLPPWRKHGFVQQKWFGEYKRTANLFPATFSAAAPPSSSSTTTEQMFLVKCRSVGFDASAVNGSLLISAATRTR